MNTNYKSRWIFSAALVAVAGFHNVKEDFTFTLGHYYSANYHSREIIEYDSEGEVVGSLTVEPSLADEIRGIAFGPDGLLYATAVRDRVFAVLALDRSGAVEQAYPMSSGYLAGNLSYGKIAVGDRYIYVAGANQLTRFEIGKPRSGTPIFRNNQVFDVEILPSGNLLAASAYEVNEITGSGELVGRIRLGGNYFTDIRGIAYNPITNELFVTHLGHSNFYSQLMRIDAASGRLKGSVTFDYADDLFLTASGNLLVGSRTQVPQVFTQNLEQAGALGTAPQMFVTQLVGCRGCAKKMRIA